MPYRDLTTFGGHRVTPYAVGHDIGPGANAWWLSYLDEGDDSDERPVSPGFLALFDAFLDAVPGRDVAALVIGCWGYAAFNRAPVAPLAAAADRLPALRSIFLGDMTDDECEISWITQDDITPLLAAYPRLELLGLRGSDRLALRPVRHGALRELVIESGGLSGAVVRAVGECDLPALETLELWLGTEAYGGDTTVPDLVTILSGERLPSLRRLRLRNAEHADEVAAAVAASAVLPRLETLDLSLGTLTDEGAEALLAAPLGHLTRLDLRHHFLSDAMCDRLRAALPGVVDVSEPAASDLSTYGDEDRRYTAVGE